jgi:hypothetical protein
VSSPWDALALASAFSVLIALIEITSKSKARFRDLLNTRFVLYVLILVLGNALTTLAASALPVLTTKIPPAFWDSMIGVFGFEAVLQNINLTFSDKGVLTIHDWINKARDSAVATAIELQEDAKEQREQALAQRLKGLPEPELNAHVVNQIGNDALQELNERSKQLACDPQLLKALALAKADYRKASGIQLPRP